MTDIASLPGALVTGGGTGIGLASARRLTAMGFAVTICGRRTEVLEAAAAELGPTARWIGCDVTDDAQVSAATTAAAEGTAGLRAVVANAGGAATAGPLVLTDLDGWNATLAVNLTATLSTIKHSAPLIARTGGGSIVAVSSIAGHLTHRNLGAYAVAKAGIEMLVRNSADELGAFGVRVNGVRPGLVPTDISAGLAGDDVTRADYLAQMPLGRVGTPEDVAALIGFLSGPDSSWITGQLIGVDGGHGLRRGPNLDNLFEGFFGPAVAELMGTA